MDINRKSEKIITTFIFNYELYMNVLSCTIYHMVWYVEISVHSILMVNLLLIISN